MSSRIRCNFKLDVSRTKEGKPRAGRVGQGGALSGAALGAACGEGDGVEGDAVVPNAYATLPGARNITIDGVFHSMSKVGTYDESAAESTVGDMT